METITINLLALGQILLYKLKIKVKNNSPHSYFKYQILEQLYLKSSELVGISLKK